MKYSLPILLATDRNTDVGSDAVEGGYGLWSEHGDLQGALKNVQELCQSQTLRTDMGIKGLKKLKDDFSVLRSVKKIEKLFFKS